LVEFIVTRREFCLDDPMIRALPNPEYLKELLRRIRKARKSVVAVNYLAEISAESGKGRKAEDPVRDLALSLIAAKRRGVNVTVILEGSKLDQNYPFYRMLRDKGGDVWMDTSKTFIHQKSVLIDERILFLGSHNWARGPLTASSELSALTDDKRSIKTFVHELQDITRQRDDILAGVCREGVELSLSILSSVMRPLFRTHAGNVFDLYMILCREDGGRPRPLPIDEETWGRELGFDPDKAGKDITPKYRKYYFKQRVNNVLNQMRKRFSLIEIDRETDTVIRKPLPEDEKKLFVPRTYWELGWPVRLGLGAKYFYLISLAEKQDSPFSPWWSRPLTELRKRYRCSQEIILGARELSNYNILEVIRSVPVKRGGRYSQEAHFYRTNPFYDMKDFEKKLKGLEKRFSKRSVRLGRNIASMLHAEFDPGTIDAISDLVKRYSPSKVRTSARKIAALHASSSRRCLDYLIQIVTA